MDIARSNIVKSIAGRDAGSLFFVLALGAFHAAASAVRQQEGSGPAADKIRSSEKITNSELRKALAAVSGGNQDQEG